MYCLATRKYLLDKYNTADVEFFGWGAGRCFTKNLDIVLDVFNMKRICDSDGLKWGIRDKGVLCIAPEELVTISNVFVIIISEKESIAREVKKELEMMGLGRYLTFQEWIDEMNRR